ncbi:ABC transporter permease [Latilactobacillus sakei]|uniref:ABC transporter permease n=1 Tax=Latilactobacillus sakei TaxID=1599 RepID=UPI000C1261E6
MTKFKIIFKQVFFKNIKSPAYIIMIIMPIILLGVVLGIGKLMDQSTEPAKIAVLSQQPAEQAALQQMRGQDYVIDTQIKTQPQAAQALKQEKIDGYLIIQQGNSQYFERKDSRDFDPSGIQNQLNEMNICDPCAAS